MDVEAAFLVLPLATVFAEALGQGWRAYAAALAEPDAWAFDPIDKGLRVLAGMTGAVGTGHGSTFLIPSRVS